MTKRNWIAPEGCTYVIDTNAEATESEQHHYGGCVVAESIFHESDMALILAAPGQAKRIAELEAENEELKEYVRDLEEEIHDWRNDT